METTTQAPASSRRNRNAVAGQPGPEAAAAAEPQPEPEAATAAELQPEPEAAAAAEPQPEPEAAAAAEPQPEPEAATAAELQPEPEAAAAAEPQPEPEAAAAAEPQPEPEAATAAELQPEPEAAAAAEPQPEPQPEPISAVVAGVEQRLPELVAASDPPAVIATIEQLHDAYCGDPQPEQDQPFYQPTVRDRWHCEHVELPDGDHEIEGLRFTIEANRLKWVLQLVRETA